MNALAGSSTDKTVPGVTGENNEGYGLRGISTSGTGVVGTSDSGVAVWGKSVGSTGVGGVSTSGSGVHGVSESGEGVRGGSKSAAGVHGVSESGQGVLGSTKSGTGVVGTSDSGVAVWGKSVGSTGVGGVSTSGSGVHGVSESGEGVRGGSKSAAGVHGLSESAQGVHGKSHANAGVFGESDEFDGVLGLAHKKDKAGVSGHNPGGLAGYFDGDVSVTGDLVLVGGDYAEEFDVGSPYVAAGSCVVLDADGSVVPCCDDYDTRVAGVVSGAGGMKPGIVLDQQKQGNRAPIALMGKAWVMVDADRGSVQPGDMLTTSTTPGHAMRVTDSARAFGAVIGKALTSMPGGRGFVKVFLSAH